MPDYPVREGYHTVEEYTVPEDTVRFLVDNFKKHFGNVIKLGTTSDQVLEILPVFLQIWAPTVLGKDKDGLVVEWDYGNIVLTFAYAQSEYDSQYCVQQIQVRDEIQ